MFQARFRVRTTGFQIQIKSPYSNCVLLISIITLKSICLVQFRDKSVLFSTNTAPAIDFAV